MNNTFLRLFVLFFLKKINKSKFHWFQQGFSVERFLIPGFMYKTDYCLITFCHKQLRFLASVKKAAHKYNRINRYDPTYESDSELEE